MGNVVDLPVITKLDLDPERVLEKARGKLQRVTIIGVDSDGEEYFSSSVADGGTILWDIERAKLLLLRVADNG